MRHHIWRDRLLTLLLWLTLGNGLALAALDPITNFAESTLATGITSVDTLFNVAAGTGVKFPSSYTYPIVLYNCTDYGRASQDPNVEIVTVTNRATDTFTVTRGQEGTTAVAHNTAGKTYCVELNLTKGMWDRIQTTINGVSGASIADVVDCSSDSSCNDVVTTIGSSTKTLRLSNTQPVASNLTLGSNITVECTGSGMFAIANGVTITAYSPEQFKCSPLKQIFTFTGTGALVFTNPGRVWANWCGAVPGDSTDDAGAMQKCHDALPSTGGIVELAAGDYKINAEVLSAKNDVLFRFPNATLDMSGMLGTGTAGIHGSVNVLAAIKLSGVRQRIVGGRITGTSTVNTDKNAVGVLLNGASMTRISSIKIDSLYAGVWAINNTTDLTLNSVELSGNGYNLYLGGAASPTNPQVTRATIINGNMHGATIGAGILAESFVFDLQVLGGYYYANAGSGIEVEVGGERLQIIGTNAYSNTVNGIRLRYHSTLGGTIAGKWGLARRLVVADNILRNNTGDNLSAQLDDYSVFSATGGLEELVISGNWSEGSGGEGYELGCVRCTIANNGAYRNTGNGFLLRSLAYASVQGNQAWDNGTTSSRKTGFLFSTAATTGSTPPNSTGVTFSGNLAGDTRSGTNRTQAYGFDLLKLETSSVLGNLGNNHFTSDWTATNGLTAVAFLQNTGTVDGTNTIGAPMMKHLIGSKTYDPPSTANSAQWSTTVTVTGAALGDVALCGFSTAMPISWLFRGHVTAADTVTCSADNYTGGTVDLASGTLIAEVWKH